MDTGYSGTEDYKPAAPVPSGGTELSPEDAPGRETAGVEGSGLGHGEACGVASTPPRILRGLAGCPPWGVSVLPTHLGRGHGGYQTTPWAISHHTFLSAPLITSVFFLLGAASQAQGYSYKCQKLGGS